jgi:isopenicillin N synthase-like dioxygenase
LSSIPTPKYVTKCTPFPFDTSVADIPIVSFQKLRQANEYESERSNEACREHGFFVVDFKGSEHGKQLLRDAEKMFDLTAEILNVERETLDH